MKHITLDQILAQPVEVQEALHDAWKPEKFDIVYAKGLGSFSLLDIDDETNETKIIITGVRGYFKKHELIHLPTMQWLIEFVKNYEKDIVSEYMLKSLNDIFIYACYVAKAIYTEKVILNGSR